MAGCLLWYKFSGHDRLFISTQELCESQGGQSGLPIPADVKQHLTIFYAVFSQIVLINENLA